METGVWVFCLNEVATVFLLEFLTLSLIALTDKVQHSRKYQPHCAVSLMTISKIQLKLLN